MDSLKMRPTRGSLEAVQMPVNCPEFDPVVEVLVMLTLSMVVLKLLLLLLLLPVVLLSVILLPLLPPVQTAGPGIGYSL